MRLFKLPAPKSGFSIIEFVLASSLAMIVFAGVLSLQATVFTQRVKMVKQVNLNVMAEFTSQAIHEPIKLASEILTPSVGSSGATLVGYLNADPETLTAIDPSKPATFFMICTENAVRTSAIHIRRGALPMPAGFQCADVVPRVSDQKITGSTASRVSFLRLGENLLSLSYQLGASANQNAPIDSTTVIQLRRGG